MDLARLEPPPPKMQQLLRAVQSSQEAMDDFVSVIAGTLPVPTFLAPDNTERIVASALTAAPR